MLVSVEIIVTRDDRTEEVRGRLHTVKNDDVRASHVERIDRT